MTIEQVLDLNNRAVFFINEARYLLAIPPLVRCARYADGLADSA